MKKRIIALLIAAITTMAHGTMLVSAKTYFADDASEYRLDGIDSKAPWTVSKGASQLHNITVEDGIIKIESPAGLTSGNGIELTAKYVNAPMERTVSFDFMNNGIGKYVVANYWTPVYQSNGVDVIGRIQMYFYETRVAFGNHGENHDQYVAVPYTKGIWYSFAFKTVMIEGKATTFLYYKEKDAEEYTLVSTRLYPNTTATPNANTNTFRFMVGAVAATASQPNQSEANFYVDNFRVYDGINLESGNFTLDGEQVKTVADVTSGGVLAGNAVITDYRTDFNESAAIKTILVAYGSDGMMYDCSVNKNVEIEGGANEISVEVDISDFYEELEYAGLFVWDGMQPISKAIELK